MTKTQLKYLRHIEKSGYMSVSTIDAMLWRRRQILDNMVSHGLLRKYRISPSYDGYAKA